MGELLVGQIIVQKLHMIDDLETDLTGESTGRAHKLVDTASAVSLDATVRLLDALAVELQEVLPHGRLLHSDEITEPAEHVELHKLVITQGDLAHIEHVLVLLPEMGSDVWVHGG